MAPAVRQPIKIVERTHKEDEWWKQTLSNSGNSSIAKCIYLRQSIRRHAYKKNQISGIFPFSWIKLKLCKFYTALWRAIRSPAQCGHTDRWVKQLLRRSALTTLMVSDVLCVNSITLPCPISAFPRQRPYGRKFSLSEHRQTITDSNMKHINQ